MHGCMDAWMHGCMDAWMHGCMDAWMHGCMDAWMHGCMDAWMHGRVRPDQNQAQLHYQTQYEYEPCAIKIACTTLKAKNDKSFLIQHYLPNYVFPWCTFL
jgi:hypothetical protein